MPRKADGTHQLSYRDAYEWVEDFERTWHRRVEIMLLWKRDQNDRLHTLVRIQTFPATNTPGDVTGLWGVTHEIGGPQSMSMPMAIVAGLHEIDSRLEVRARKADGTQGDLFAPGV